MRNQSGPAPARKLPGHQLIDVEKPIEQARHHHRRRRRLLGQVAQCGWAAPGWSCKIIPDERAALESEIARLQRDNAELKKSLLSHGLELPSGIVAEAPVAPPVPPANVPDPSAKEPKMPSDAELDRAFAFMKNVWRRLVDMMVDLQRDMQKKS